MSKVLAKRRSLLKNTKLRHKEREKQLKGMKHVPTEEWEYFVAIGEQIARAEKLFETPEGEYEVERAASLAGASTASDAAVGLSVRGVVGMRRKKEDQNTINGPTLLCNSWPLRKSPIRAGRNNGLARRSQRDTARNPKRCANGFERRGFGTAPTPLNNFLMLFVLGRTPASQKPPPS